MARQTAQTLVTLHIYRFTKNLRQKREINTPAAREIHESRRLSLFSKYLRDKSLLIFRRRLRTTLLHIEVRRVDNILASSPSWHLLFGLFPPCNLVQHIGHIHLRILVGLKRKLSHVILTMLQNEVRCYKFTHKLFKKATFIIR